MNVLVTGGAGFIGSNIAERLLELGHKVKIIDNFSTGHRSNIDKFIKDVELFEGDIRGYHTVTDAVKGSDVILHQAALPSVPRSIIDPITTNEVNVGGTLNILNAAKVHKVKRIVFASSSSVYGNNPTLPKHEKMLPVPLSPYAVSKNAGENYMRSFNLLYGIETISLRYFNVFGPKQDPNSQYSAVIPKFIKAINNGIQPTIFGDGKQSRDFTYIANIVDANILAATKDCDTPLLMNCATHDQITLNRLVDEINILTNKNVRPIYSSKRPGDILHSYADIGLIKETLDYKPKIDFVTGLGKTIHFNSLKS